MQGIACTVFQSAPTRVASAVRSPSILVMVKVVQIGLLMCHIAANCCSQLHVHRVPAILLHACQRSVLHHQQGLLQRSVEEIKLLCCSCCGVLSLWGQGYHLACTCLVRQLPCVVEQCTVLVLVQPQDASPDGCGAAKSLQNITTLSGLWVR